MKYKIDNKIYTLNELKEGYRCLTGLNNVDELSENELFEYMKNTLYEEGIENLKRVED